MSAANVTVVINKIAAIPTVQTVRMLVLLLKLMIDSKYRWLVLELE